MAWYAIHTEEIVHGVYHVEAESPEAAEHLFTDEPHKIGEQVLYEAITAEVERVEPLE